MMLQVEHGGQQLTSERRVHPLRTEASSGVGNSSAQTVDAHVHREWAGARKRSAAGGMKRSASLCGRGCRSAEADASATWKSLPLRGSPSGIIEKQLPAEKPHGSIGKQLHSAKQGTFGRATCRISSIATRNLPNRHHREAATARDGAKHHREAAPQCKARRHRDEQPAEPAPSRRATCRTGTFGRATCRTSTIGKRMFWQIMVPKGQVLRG